MGIHVHQALWRWFLIKHHGLTLKSRLAQNHNMWYTGNISSVLLHTCLTLDKLTSADCQNECELFASTKMVQAQQVGLNVHPGKRPMRPHGTPWDPMGPTEPTEPTASDAWRWQALSSSDQAWRVRGVQKETRKTNQGFRMVQGNQVKIIGKPGKW